MKKCSLKKKTNGPRVPKEKERKVSRREWKLVPNVADTTCKIRLKN